MLKRNRIRRLLLVLIPIALLGSAGYYWVWGNPNWSHEWGEVVDNYQGVNVYYNGGTGQVNGRNTTADGYNLGLKYQCVEFVKRFYYEHYQHQMPDSWGHAKSFYQDGLADGAMNSARGLLQFTNGSQSKPMPGDLLVMGGGTYGHVAIISAVTDNEVEIIQQNPGPFSSSRATYTLENGVDGFVIKHDRILGWLRMP